jgi:CheY-like chemotaxis protein
MLSAVACVALACSEDNNTRCHQVNRTAHCSGMRYRFRVVVTARCKYAHQTVPSNDGGISVAQTAIATVSCRHRIGEMARARVFVVEDDADTQAALVKLLGDAGYEVASAIDGQQALNMLMQGQRPHVMIVDLMLPSLSGSEFLHYVETDPDHRMIPRIVMTGLPKEDVRVVADAIFYKPCDFTELLATLRRMVPPG